MIIHFRLSDKTRAVKKKEKTQQNKKLPTKYIGIMIENGKKNQNAECRQDLSLILEEVTI